MIQGIFVGLSTIDLIYNVDNFPVPNSKIAARSQQATVGGPATNAAITFSHLGGQATLVSAVGRHALANMIHEELRQYSIELQDLNPGFDELPVISSIAVNPSGDRNIVSANASRVTTVPSQPDEDLIRDAQILMIDGHYMEECQSWARAFRSTGKEVILDGGSWKHGMDELLRHVSIAICSADFRPPRCRTEDDVIRDLKARGVEKIAVTRGALPVRFLSNGLPGVVPVPVVKRIDTTGAGDIFHGAFCHYAALGHGFVQALAEAAEIASESCRYYGTREWMRVEKERALDMSLLPL